MMVLQGASTFQSKIKTIVQDGREAMEYQASKQPNHGAVEMTVARSQIAGSSRVFLYSGIAAAALAGLWLLKRK